MARPLRIEFSGALYHVTSRGNDRADIYLDDGDRRVFLAILGEACDLFNWRVHAWCLMDNHYHLLIETPDSNLSKGMRYLNGVYTQKINRLHRRVGHVFQGRFKAILVEKEAYLLELARYIVLNPVRASIVKGVEHWPWSSYGVTAGIFACPSWFDRAWLLGHFGRQEKSAIQKYMEFVSSGVQQASPWSNLKNQIYLGSDDFVEETQGHIKSGENLEVPVAQRRPAAKPISMYSKLFPDRNEAIVAAYRSGAYTLKQIGDYHALHYSTISRIVHGSMQK